VVFILGLTGGEKERSDFFLGGCEKTEWAGRIRVT
jgi:hypothetical protein